MFVRIVAVSVEAGRINTNMGMALDISTRFCKQRGEWGKVSGLQRNALSSAQRKEVYEEKDKEGDDDV